MVLASSFRQLDMVSAWPMSFISLAIFNRGSNITNFFVTGIKIARLLKATLRFSSTKFWDYITGYNTSICNESCFFYDLKYAYHRRVNFSCMVLGSSCSVLLASAQVLFTSLTAFAISNHGYSIIISFCHRDKNR